MQLIRGISCLSHPVPHPVVTIGNFDGVHLGHQKIIQVAIEQAKSKQGQCVGYTFRPHPLAVLQPTHPPQLISTYEEKIQILSRLGVDLMIEESFSQDFSSIEPNEFFQQFLMDRLKAESIVVGYDFVFGKQRHGDLKVLEAFCKTSGVDLLVVSAQKIDGEVVSSSKIRKYLFAGEIEAANQFLGRQFSYQGVVIHGEGRGKMIGFPTANFNLEDKLVLPFGVYATLTVIHEVEYLSVTHIGIRPTFQKDGQPAPICVETFLLDQKMDLYGTCLEVRFFSRIREERKFSQIQDLQEQIKKDIELTRIRLS